MKSVEDLNTPGDLSLYTPANARAGAFAKMVTDVPQALRHGNIAWRDEGERWTLRAQSGAYQWWLASVAGKDAPSDETKAAILDLLRIMWSQP
jgi:hypothetical protein